MQASKDCDKMRHAKIVETEIVQKRSGFRYTILDIRNGKRGRGKVLFTTFAFPGVEKSHKRLAELNGQTFVHSSLTLAYARCYDYAVKNNIDLGC